MRWCRVVTLVTCFSLFSVGFCLVDPNYATVAEVVADFAQSNPAFTQKALMEVGSLIPGNQTSEYISQLMTALQGRTADSLCTACQLTVNILRLALQKNGYPAVQQLMIQLCGSVGTAMNPATKVNIMCPGAIQIQGPHVNAVLSQPITALSFCQTVNACYNVSRIQVGWPPALKNAKSSPSGTGAQTTRPVKRKRRNRDRRKHNKTFRIAQITDVHLEPEYAAGSPTECGLYVCCQNQSAPGLGHAGYYGDYNCNVPKSTMDLFIKKIKDLDPDLVLFSGDVPPHTSWSETLQSQLNCTTRLVQSMKNIFGQEFRVLPCIGNHEMYPTNLFSVKFMPKETVPLLSSFASLWQQLAHFRVKQMKSMRRGGYYVTQVAHRLRLISLSTNYMYANNYYNALNRDEIMKMRRDIEKYLQVASCEGQKVIIMAHHVVGSSDVVVDDAKWYEELMVAYSDIIVLQIAGHTHVDEFRLLSDSSFNVKTMLYVSPSIDTHGFKNPSVRLYELDANSFELLDYTQYYFDLNKLDPTSSVEPEIVELYSAKEEYGLKDLSPASWLDLLNRFTTDRELLLRHIRHSNADASQTGGFACDANCTVQHICQMRYASYDRYQACVLQYGGQPQPSTTGAGPRGRFPGGRTHCVKRPRGKRPPGKRPRGKRPLGKRPRGKRPHGKLPRGRPR